MDVKKKVLAGSIVAVIIFGIILNVQTSTLSVANGDLKNKNKELEQQVTELKTQNDDYKNRLTKYELNISNTKDKTVPTETEKPPVELSEISFDKSGVTGVNVIFVNRAQKTIDAIEFVILQFDNFGRPAYRFNDKSDGNVTSVLTMQGKATTNQTMKSGWTLYNTDKTTKGKIVIKQVHFTDGAVWQNLKFDEQVKQEKEAL